MRKRLMYLTGLLLYAVSLAACSGETDSVAASGMESVTETVSATEAVSETVSFAERVAALRESDTDRIFDDCGVLTAEEESACNKYAAWLEETYGIQAAVVLTEQLDGASADSFAAVYYDTLYGSADGFLVLINNDTNEDRVYTVGACRASLTEEAIALALAQSTPALVRGEYASAVERLLQLGEAMAQTESSAETTADTQNET